MKKNQTKKDCSKNHGGKQTEPKGKLSTSRYKNPNTKIFSDLNLKELT